MSLHFQCFALLPQALTQSPQQGRPAADHMARLPDQVMTWSHNMYSLSPSSLRQCPPRFTRHVLQRFSHTIVNWPTASTATHTALCSWLKESRRDWILLTLRRKFIFSVWKGGSVIVFSHATSDRSAEAAPLLSSLHAPHHSAHRYRLVICTLSDHFRMINYGL